MDKYRKHHPVGGSSVPGSLFGYFRMRIALRTTDRTLEIISSGERHAPGGLGSWEHVSVSVSRKPQDIPTWLEMCFVKDLFWTPEETVVQFHPAKSDYVNVYNCLHLWKPPYEVVLPPKIALA